MPPSLAALTISINSSSTVAAATNLGAMTVAAGKANTAVGTANATFSRFVHTTGRLQTQLHTLTKTMGPLLFTFAAFRTARNGIAAIAEFEQVMAETRAVVIKTTDSMAIQQAQFDALSKSARDLGATTKFSAAEAAQGQLLLAKAGFTVNEVLAATPGVLDLATAATMDLGRAAEITGNVLRQFGLKAEDAAKVGDVLITVANATSTEIEDLAQGMKFAGPVAAALGMSLEETAASLGVMSDAGIKGALGGTTFRGVILSLLSPSKQAREVLDRLAARIGTTREVFNTINHSAEEVFKSFKKAGAGIEEFELIFGKRNVAGAQVLSERVDRINEVTKAAHENVDAVKKMADIMNNTLSGAWGRLMKAANALAISLGEAGLLDALRAVTEFLTQVFRALSGAEDKITSSKTAAILLADAIKILVVTFSALIAIKIVVWFALLLKSIFSVTAAMKLFNATMAVNPFVLVVTAIAGVVTSLDAMGISWRDTLNAIIDACVWFVNKMISLFVSLFDTIMTPLIELGKAFSSLADFDFTSPIESAKQIGTAFSKLSDVGNKIGDNWKDNFNRQWLQEIFGTGIWHFTGKEAGKAVGDGIVDGLEQSGPKVQTAADLLIEHRINLIKDAKTAITDLKKELEDLKSSDGEDMKRFKQIEAFKELLNEGFASSGQGILSGIGDSAKADLLKQFLDVLEQIDRVKAIIKKGKEADEAAKSYEELLEKTKGFLALIGQTEKVTKAAEARALLMKAYGGDMDVVNDKMKEFLAVLDEIDKKEAIKKQGEQAERAAEDFEEMLVRLREQIELVGQTEHGRDIVRAHRLAVKAFGEDQQKVNEKTAEYIELIKQLEAAEVWEKISWSLSKIKDLSRDMSEALASSLKDMVFGAKSVEEAARDFANTVLSSMFDRLVAQPLVEMLTQQLTGLLSTLTSSFTFGSQVLVAGTMFSTTTAAAGATFAASITAAGAGLIASASTAAAIMAGGGIANGLGGALGSITQLAAPALGGVGMGGLSLYQAGPLAGTPIPVLPPSVLPGLAHGGVVNFASGGMMATGRTSFNMPDGRQGVFGESGPELGFFPLDRGADGRLGIKQTKSKGGGNVSKTTVVNMVVKASDPNAFRASRGQIMADARRAARLGG